MNLAVLVERLGRDAPDRPAWIDPNGASDWGRVATRVARLAGALRARGLKPGDRVALLARNSPSFFETLLAAAWAGLVIAPLNWRLSAAEIAFQIADTEAALIALEPEFLPKLAESDAGIARLIMQDDLERAMRDAPAIAPPAALDRDALFGIFYTGGTTGAPKGVMLTHGNLLANVANLRTLAPYAASDVHLHAAPMFHLADLGYAIMALAGGSAHAFLPRFAPEAFLECVSRVRASATLLAPAMIAALMQSPALAEANLGSWRRLMYGGSPIAAPVLEAALARLPCALIQGYGQTEATHTIAMLSDADHRKIAARPELALSCGRAAPNVEIAIFDESDARAPAGEAGEVCVRAATVMPGYWRRPEETAAALRGGWLRTGDIGRFDGSGYLTLLDRRKDMIVSGAENVYSVEVENALAAHLAVAEAAVIAAPDARWGERVHAVVALAPGRAATQAELQAHCRALIGAFKIPRSIEFVAALPRSATGKVRKDLLRAPHWRGQARQIG